jgi:hypothetical protein
MFLPIRVYAYRKGKLCLLSTLMSALMTTFFLRLCALTAYYECDIDLSS